MIKKLQYRFILVTMACIGFILVLILLSLNISVTAASESQGYAMLSEYVNRKDPEKEAARSEHGPSPKELPSLPEDKTAPKGSEKERPSFSEEMKQNQWFNDMRIFSITFDADGQTTEISTGGNPNLTEADLQAMADIILKNPKEEGRLSGYLYLYVPSEEETSIYFLDYAPEHSMSLMLLQVCLWIGLAGMLVILILVIFLSRWVSRPVQLAFDRQRQFIADASHELKTPLAIITTNAEVLEGSLPGNKWLNYILEQSGRMKTLINSLLDLAKLDACVEKQIFRSFDLSRTVRNTALSFESLAYEYGKKYTMEIADGLTACGNEEQIKQLVNILLDNAFKYSDRQGHILISLAKHGEKKLLKVYNTGNGIDAKDQKHIFERFYRSDSSRSRESGGYGLGLSIAQSIVKSHRGRVSVKSDGKSYTEFSVLFP